MCCINKNKSSSLHFHQGGKNEADLHLQEENAMEKRTRRGVHLDITALTAPARHNLRPGCASIGEPKQKQGHAELQDHFPALLLAQADLAGPGGSPRGR